MANGLVCALLCTLGAGIRFFPGGIGGITLRTRLVDGLHVFFSRLFWIGIRHKIDLLCGQYSTVAGREQEERRNTMPRRVTADVPTEEAILAYNNVPIELAAKFIGWSDITIRYALQEERAPFGMAAQNPKTGTWSYNISPGLLLKYKSGELPAWKLKDLSTMLADHAERIIDERVGSVGKLIDKLLGGKSA